MPVVRVERLGGDALSAKPDSGLGGEPEPAAAVGRPAAQMDILLRPALEAALAVAREGEEDTPSSPAPVSLRPFLRFAKLPPRALAATRRVLDTDEEFRARVAEAADQGAVGRAGWLFLDRPEGWEDELRELVESAEEIAGQEAERRAENDARRRLAGAEEAARRAEQAAAAARTEAAQALAALADERRARQVAADEAAAVSRRLEAVAAERERVRASARAAADEAGTLRRRVTDLEEEVRTLREELAAASPPGPQSVAADAAALSAPPVVDLRPPSQEVRKG